MNKLTALIEAAKAATPLWDRWNGCDGPCDDYVALANPATILELFALLEKAEKALDKYRGQVDRFGEHTSVEALAAIKQWKKKT